MLTNCWQFLSGNGMGWMMAGAGVFWLIVLTLLILATAALIKYLRSDERASRQ